MKLIQGRCAKSLKSLGQDLIQLVPWVEIQQALLLQCSLLAELSIGKVPVKY